VQLEFNLGTVREVNVLEIEPASQFGLIIENISYADGNNVITNLDIPETTIGSDASIRFRKIATDRIILTVRNENSCKTNFKFNEDVDPLFDQALAEQPIKAVPNINSVSAVLKEAIPSTKIQEAIGLQDVVQTEFQGRQFTTGIDNVRLGIAEHEPRSVYVSEPLEICGVGELGIRTVECRPYLEGQGQTIKFTTTTYDVDQDSSLTDDSTLTVGQPSNTYFQASTEYWIVKQDFDSSDNLLRTRTFPILPLDVDRIYHERLVLNAKSVSTLSDNDLGELMFFTNVTDGDIKVYKNGLLEVDATADPDPSSGWQNITTVADRTPNNGTPMKFKIKVIGGLPGDIYTVSYTPLTSSTQSVPKNLSEFVTIGGLNTVDLIGDLSARTCAGQIVILNRIGEDDTTEVSNVFLVIMFRQNSAEPTLTPAVEEYTLVGGCKDLTKFEEV
jgi:hypothetical protein